MNTNDGQYIRLTNSNQLPGTEQHEGIERP